MIVCQCRGITDRQIRKAVRDGASSRNEVVLACTAGTTCGGCFPEIDAILDSEGESITRVLPMAELATG